MGDIGSLIEGTLVKIVDCENPRHVDNIKSGSERHGVFSAFPQVEHPFFLSTKKDSLSGLFRTSPVTEIVEESDTVIIFKTSNSYYRLRYQKNEIDVKENKN